MGRSAPFSVISTGTWVITMAVGGTPRPLDPARDTLMNVNAFGDPVPSARFMGGREFEILTSGAPVTPTRAEITAVLNQGVTLSPAVVSTSGPFQGRRSTWSVPALELTDGERTAVASLYLAMMALTCLELTGAEGPIVTEGPFAGNTLFLDLVAAASGRQVMSSTGSATGTSIGAALLAAEGARPLCEPQPASVTGGRLSRRPGSLRGAMARQGQQLTPARQPWAAAAICSRMKPRACLARSMPSLHTLRQMRRMVERSSSTTADEKDSKVMMPS